MNVGQTLMLVLPVDANVGGSVYVPPTVCLRPACLAAYSPAYAGRTGSPRTHEFAAIRSASGMRQNSLLPEVR